MNKQEVIQLCGIPFAGKSTFARELKLKRPEIVIVVFDTHKIKNLQTGQFPPTRDRRELWTAATRDSFQTIREMLQQGRSVIYDGVSPTYKDRSAVRVIAYECDAIRQLVYFDLPEEIILRRMAENKLTNQRSAVSSPANLEKLKTEFEEPRLDEVPITIFRSIDEISCYLDDLNG